MLQSPILPTAPRVPFTSMRQQTFCVRSPLLDTSLRTGFQAPQHALSLPSEPTPHSSQLRSIEAENATLRAHVQHLQQQHANQVNALVASNKDTQEAQRKAENLRLLLERSSVNSPEYLKVTLDCFSRFFEKLAHNPRTPVSEHFEEMANILMSLPVATPHITKIRSKLAKQVKHVEEDDSSKSPYPRDLQFVAALTNDRSWFQRSAQWAKCPSALKWLAVAAEQPAYLSLYRMYEECPPDLQYIAVLTNDERWLQLGRKWNQIPLYVKFEAVMMKDMSKITDWISNQDSETLLQQRCEGEEAEIIMQLQMKNFMWKPTEGKPDMTYSAMGVAQSAAGLAKVALDSLSSKFPMFNNMLNEDQQNAPLEHAVEPKMSLPAVTSKESSKGLPTVNSAVMVKTAPRASKPSLSVDAPNLKSTKTSPGGVKMMSTTVPSLPSLKPSGTKKAPDSGSSPKGTASSPKKDNNLGAAKVSSSSIPKKSTSKTADKGVMMKKSHSATPPSKTDSAELPKMMSIVSLDTDDSDIEGPLDLNGSSSTAKVQVPVVKAAEVNPNPLKSPSAKKVVMKVPPSGPSEEPPSPDTGKVKIAKKPPSPDMKKISEKITETVNLKASSAKKAAPTERYEVEESVGTPTPVKSKVKANLGFSEKTSSAAESSRSSIESQVKGQTAKFVKKLPPSKAIDATAHATIGAAPPIIQETTPIERPPSNDRKVIGSGGPTLKTGCEESAPMKGVAKPPSGVFTKIALASQMTEKNISDDGPQEEATEAEDRRPDPTAPATKKAMPPKLKKGLPPGAKKTLQKKVPAVKEPSSE